MPIPKQPILSNPDSPIVGVPGPDGVLETAVPPTEPRPPVPPPQPAPLAGAVEGEPGPTGAAGTAVDAASDPFFLAVQQAAQALSGAPAAGTPGFLTPEQRILERTEQVLPEAAFGAFQPGSVEERAAVRRGRASAPFKAGFSDGLLGMIFSGEPESQFSRDRAMAELINYSARNPWKSTLTQIAGGFLSDSPIEIGLALGTLGVGNAVVTAARASGRGASSLRNIAAGVQKLRRAYRPAPGTALTRAGFRRLSQRGLFETSLGLVSGMVSASLQQALGKEGDITDIIERGVFDAAFSSPFFESLRFAGRALRLSRGAIGRQLSKSVAEDNPHLRADDINTGVQRGLEAAGDEADFRAIDKDAATRSIDDLDEVRQKGESTPEINQAIRRYNKNKNPTNLFRAFTELIDDPDPTVRHRRASELMDVLRRRTRSAGMTLNKYLKTKRLRLAIQNTPSQIITNTNNIIAAPSRATSVAELFHEIGHLVFADLNDAHRNAAIKLLGFSPDRQLPREAYEAFAEAFREFVEKGTAKNRQQKRMFQRVLDWFRNVYRRLRNRPPVETIDDLFRKMIPEDELRLDSPQGRLEGLEEEPFATPDRQRELLEARKRAESGLAQLFAPPRKSKKKVKEITVEEAARRKKLQEEQERMVKSANEAAEGVEFSPWLPRTKAAERKRGLERRQGRLLYYDNLSLYNVLRRFGAGFEAFVKPLRESVNKSAKLSNKMHMTRRNGVKKRGLNPKDMVVFTKKSTVRLQIQPQKGVKEFAVGEVDVELTGAERLDLYMYSMDGFDSSKKKVAKHSAQQSLTARTGGFIDPNNPSRRLVLTEEQLKAIQNGSIISDTEKAYADVMFDTFRSIVPEANRMSQSLLGINIMSPENHFYNPKITRAKEGDSLNDIQAIARALTGDKEARALLSEGNLRTRKGAAPLELTNPFREMSIYINQMPDVIAKAKIMTQIKLGVDKASPVIKRGWSPDMVAMLNDVIDVNMGSRDVLGPANEGRLVTRLFSLGIIGKLGLNLSVIGKQFASAATAVATGKLNATPWPLGRQAFELFFKNAERERIVAEAAQHSDLMAMRVRSKPQIIEFDDAQAGLSDIQLFHGDLSLGQMRELLQAGGVNLTDAAMETVQKTTSWIKRADESTLASIWNQVKKDVQLEGQIEFESDKFFSTVADRFNDIMLESQPTVDPATRSLNQMRRGLLFRGVTMFSTQTRKNNELFDEAVSKRLNIENPTADDNRELFKVALPLLLQTAYVTAVGTGVAAGMNEAMSVLQSEKRQKQIAIRQQGVMAKLTSSFLRDLLGQKPIIGKLSADLVNATFGTKPFKQAIPIVDELTKFSEGMSQGSIRKMMDGVQQVVGVPTVIRRPISETAGRLQE